MGLGLREIREQVATLASSFDPALLSPADAERVVTDATATLNMLETVRALAARRAADGGALVHGKGKRPLVPPDDPRHPRHYGNGAAEPRAG